MTLLQSIDSGQNSRLRLAVPQLLEPTGELISLVNFIYMPTLVHSPRYVNPG